MATGTLQTWRPVVCRPAGPVLLCVRFVDVRALLRRCFFLSCAEDKSSLLWTVPNLGITYGGGESRSTQQHGFGKKIFERSGGVSDALLPMPSSSCAQITEEKLRAMRSGCTIDGVRYKGMYVRVEGGGGKGREGRNAWLTIECTEGKVSGVKL